MTGILIAMALVSIFAECFKLCNLDVVLKHHDMQTKARSLEESDTKTLILHGLNNKLFTNPILLTALITDAVYTVFIVVLLFTRHWYIGLAIIVMTMVQKYLFEHKKVSTIIDSILCTILMILYIVLI